MLICVLLSLLIKSVCFNTNFNRKNESPINSNINDITVVSPNNKTYVNKMPGYYPASYGFENQSIGDEDLEIGWIDFDNPGSSKALIQGEYEGHKNIVNLHDVSTGEPATAYHYSSQSYGTVEFWFSTNDVSQRSEIYFYSGGSPTNFIWIKLENGRFQYHDGSSFIDIPYVGHPESDKWYHIRIDFRCDGEIIEWQGLNQNRWRFILNGINSGELTPRSTKSSIVRYNIVTNNLGVYDIYIDAVGHSWDSYYAIGNNREEGILLSFECSSSLDWLGYSLDGYANISVSGDTVLSISQLGSHSIQVFGKDTSSDIHESEIVIFTIGVFEIKSPGAMNYSAPMRGYFPATFGFEEDLLGSENGDITWVDNGGSAENITIITQLDDHKNVMQLNDKSSTVKCSAIHESTQTYGTWEFWMRTTDTSKRSDFVLYSGGVNPIYYINFRLDNNAWLYNNFGSWEAIPGMLTPENNRWYHCQVDFRCNGAGSWRGLNNNRWRIIVDGINSGELNPRTTKSQVLELRFETDSTGKDYSLYVDAVGLSWDPAYNIGDNLNEGLFLSFQTSFTLDWAGYSLDLSPNVTIYGNTTVNCPEDGIHSIELSAMLPSGEFIKSKEVTFTVSIDPGTPNPPLPPPIPPTYDWIFFIALPIGIGVISLLVIYILTTRSGKIKKERKGELAIESDSKNLLLCPYCKTKIDANSNFCPYCSSKIIGDSIRRDSKPSSEG